MTYMKFGRKVFGDQGIWYHVDYMCRREVVEIGTWRKAMRFMGCKGDPMGSPVVRKVVAR